MVFLTLRQVVTRVRILSLRGTSTFVWRCGTTLCVAVWAGCATTNTQPAAAATGNTTTAHAPVNSTAPVAVRLVEAPGFAMDTLTEHLAVALREEGIVVVDAVSVRDELAGCTRAPCPDALAQRYEHAVFTVGASLSRVADVAIASVWVERDGEHLAQKSGRDADANVAMANAGRALGASLRSMLTTPLSTTASPASAEAANQGSTP